MTVSLAESDGSALIARLAKECAAGVSDRESEALNVAAERGLAEEWVKAIFADARKLRKSKPSGEIRKGRRLIEFQERPPKTGTSKEPVKGGSKIGIEGAASGDQGGP